MIFNPWTNIFVCNQHKCMCWSVEVSSDVRSTSDYYFRLLPRNWLPRKRSASECIFRTLMARLFRQNALLLSDNGLTLIGSSFNLFYFFLFKSQMHLSHICLSQFSTDLSSTCASTYCNPGHWFSLRRVYRGLYLPDRGCRAAERILQCGRYWDVSYWHYYITQSSVLSLHLVLSPTSENVMIYDWLHRRSWEFIKVFSD